MTTNPQTQKNFFSKVSHFFRFPKTPTYNLKPMFPISNELPRAALSPLSSVIVVFVVRHFFLKVSQQPSGFT